MTCGALGSPSVLERSGVGNAQILQKAGIDVVVDLPGVGANYQDHHLMVYPYLSDLNERQTLDALCGGRMDPVELIKQNDPMLGWNGMDVTVKLRPTEAEVAELGPTFRKAWDKDFKNIPNKPLVGGSPLNA